MSETAFLDSTFSSDGTMPRSIYGERKNEETRNILRVWKETLGPLDDEETTNIFNTKHRASHLHHTKDTIHLKSQETSKRATSFIPKFEWIGVVDSIDFEIGLFKARVQDQLSNDIGEEIAEFEIEDLSELNKHRLKEGAIFYWTIGYELEKMTKKKASKIVFKTTPNNLKCLETIAETRAKEFTDFFSQFK